MAYSEEITRNEENYPEEIYWNEETNISLISSADIMWDANENKTYMKALCIFYENLFSSPELRIHLYQFITLVICLVGIVGNILNVAIFSRRGNTSPASIILRALSITELIILSSHTLFTCLGFFSSGSTYDKLRGYFMFGNYSNIRNFIIDVFYNIGTWLAIELAIWRFIAIAYPLHSKSWCIKRRTRTMIVVGYVFGITLQILMLLWCDYESALYPFMSHNFLRLFDSGLLHLKAWVRFLSSIALTAPSVM